MRFLIQNTFDAAIMINTNQNTFDAAIMINTNRIFMIFVPF